MQQHLLTILSSSPADWHTRLALADLYLESGDEAESRRERALAWLWAWSESMTAAGYRLCYVRGRGRRPLVAHFSTRPPAEINGRDWDENVYPIASDPEGDTVRVVFESPGHDVPADLGRQRRYRSLSVRRINLRACPWLLPTRASLVDTADGDGEEAEPASEVWAGAEVTPFCVAVTLAGGWWRPMGMTEGLGCVQPDD